MVGIKDWLGGLEEQQWREREMSSGQFATVGSEEDEQVTV
jgi:hypothetical protein